MSIHFKANLRPVVKDRTGILYWVMNPLGSGVIIAHDLSGNLVMLHNFDVGSGRTQAGCQTNVRQTNIPLRLSHLKSARQSFERP